MIRSGTSSDLGTANADRLLGCSATPLPAPNLGKLNIDERLAFLLEWMVGVARGETGAVLLLGESGRLEQRAAVGLDPSAPNTVPPDVESITFGLIVHDLDRHGHNPGEGAAPCDHWLVDAGAHMALSLPLEIHGRVLGVVRVGFAQLKTLEPAEIRRIGVIADHIAAAAEADRLARESAGRMTQLARVSAVLNEVDRMKGDFLSMISHELRTPLTAIIGYTDLLLRQVHGQLNERQLRHQQAVKKAAHRLLALVNDLLDLNRLESGQILLAHDPLLLADALRRALGEIQEAADQRGVELRLDVPSAPITVRADPERLNQILINLLDNAVKFTSAGGTVTVRIDRDGQRASVAVQDTGVGVPAEHLDRIWDRFHQADSSTRRHFGGTGLGLAIVKHLVEAHGGTVMAASDGIGHGSCFGFTLPIDEAAPARDEAPVAEDAPPPPPAVEATPATGRCVVLIVDDEPDNREVITSIVQDVLGHIALTAASGLEGLDRARARPDLILLDLRMPDLSGFEVARRLKSEPATASIPIVAITALDDEDDRRSALEAGCVGCITKPFGQEALSAAIAAVFDGSIFGGSTLGSLTPAGDERPPDPTDEGGRDATG